MRIKLAFKTTDPHRLAPTTHKPLMRDGDSYRCLHLCRLPAVPKAITPRQHDNCDQPLPFSKWHERWQTVLDLINLLQTSMMHWCWNLTQEHYNAGCTLSCCTLEDWKITYWHYAHRNQCCKSSESLKCVLHGNLCLHHMYINAMKSSI